MEKIQNKFPLHSYNEWGKLREVIVGRPFPDEKLFVDYSFCHFNFDNINEHLDIVKKEEITDRDHMSTIKYKAQYLEELKEDIDGLVMALNENGVSVLRPAQILTDELEVKLPYWEAGIWPALNVRDRMLVLGDNLVETTPCIRARYLETDLLKPIIYKFFEEGAKWLSMPRPILTDSSFDLSYIDSSIYKSASRELISMRTESYYDIGIEILMDAANCLRLGKDVLVNVADKNQYLAYQWLVSILGDKFHFHMLDAVTDNHIDSYIIIIRPGLVLVRNRKVIDKLPDFMKKWDYIIAPESSEDVFPQYEADDLIITSRYIDTNILSINENTVIANSLNPEMIHLLESHKINVIPVRHRHRRLFGGGFHCFTVDTNRESEYISYR